MENKEYDLCNKKLKEFLKKDGIGKLVFRELNAILERVFREGYELGKNSK